MIEFIYQDCNSNKYNIYSKNNIDIIDINTLISNYDLSDEFLNQVPYEIIYDLNHHFDLDTLLSINYIINLDDFIYITNQTYDMIYYKYFKQIINSSNTSLFCINSDDLYLFEIIYNYDFNDLYHSDSSIIYNFLLDNKFIKDIDYISVIKQSPIYDDCDNIVEIIEIEYYILSIDCFIKCLTISNNYYYRYYNNIKDIIEMYNLYLNIQNKSKKRKCEFETDAISKYLKY